MGRGERGVRAEGRESAMRGSVAAVEDLRGLVVLREDCTTSECDESVGEEEDAVGFEQGEQGDFVRGEVDVE